MKQCYHLTNTSVCPENRAYTVHPDTLVNNLCLTLNLLVLLMQLRSCKYNVRYFYLVQDYASMRNYNLIKVINVYALGKPSVICRHLSFSCLPILVVIYALLSTSKYPQIISLLPQSSATLSPVVLRPVPLFRVK